MTTIQTATQVSFVSSLGEKLHGSIVRIADKLITFELLRVECSLRMSEVLTEFEVTDEPNQQIIYQGKAILQNLIDSSTTTLCEARLTDAIPPETFYVPENLSTGDFREAFFSRWQTAYRVIPEYKLAVADLHTLLFDLRRLFDHIELTQGSAGISKKRLTPDAEAALIREFQPALTPLFQRFEEVAGLVSKRGENLADYHAYGRRLLHPFVLASPFMNRIFTKPLGYAGDYEMMNMINRAACGGNSIFAKLLDAFLLAQAPADAVRNRVEYFCRRIGEESSRAQAAGRTAKIWTLGCGPAQEVQQAIKRFPWVDDIHFRLLDFNDETLVHTKGKTSDLIRQYNRQTKVEMVKQSVHSLLKEMDKNPVAGAESFDLIYCSGLYDYLSNKVCKKLDTYLFKRLAPGGVLIVTNFDPYTNIRNIMEHLFDWFLIYRDAREFRTLAPEQVPDDDCFVVAEDSGCNIFLEARKRI
jgi:extracellular factor (EF) 3-hydroxypalmitic acid methyl ester biosynthesis protein